jgi:very-short-patch-repair endonuclease
MYKLTTKEFIIKFKNIYEDKYLIDLINYSGYNNKVKVICKIHGVFEQTPKKLLIYKKGCPHCNNKQKTVKELIKKFNIVHNNKFNYSLFINFKNEKSIINIICPIHGIFKQSIQNHLKYGCKKCSEKYLDKNSFIEKANKIHNNFYSYDNVDYKTNKTKVIIICPKHGDFIQIPNDHLNGAGCPICKKSRGEKIIFSYLKENNIEFEIQKKFKNCINTKNLYFDFYIKKYNMCIEFDGRQHFENSDYFGGEKEFMKIKKRDEIKNKFCLDNNIKLIRIMYNENIIEKLKDIFYNL